MSIFYEMSHLPLGILDCSVENLGQYLSGPTLVRLPGLRQPPVFVSVLLHGNEHSGFVAIQSLLKEYFSRGHRLPRECWIFFGNLEAAKRNKRRLDEGPDFNRIWDETEASLRPMVSYIKEQILKKKIEIVIDIHNNTGVNPIYSCITSPNKACLGLASLFSNFVILATEPKSALSLQFSSLVPVAMTLECGISRSPLGIERAKKLVRACLEMESSELYNLPIEHIEAYQSMARIEIDRGLSVGLMGDTGRQPDLLLRPDLEQMNFREYDSGTFLGRLKFPKKSWCRVLPMAEGFDMNIFRVRGLNIEFNQPLVPAMFTLEKEILKQDCLGYLMKRTLVELGRGDDTMELHLEGSPT